MILIFQTMFRDGLTLLLIYRMNEKALVSDFGWRFDFQSITKDILTQNQTFANEQLDLWFANRTGICRFVSYFVIHNWDEIKIKVFIRQIHAP